jgi:type IV pilus assembly protein PilO
MKIDTAALQEKLTALSPAHKALLIIGTVAVLIGGFYFLQYQDNAARIQKLTKQVDSQQKKLVELKAAAAQVEVLEKDLVLAEEDLARMVALLPDQKEIPNLLESVSKIGAQAGLENILFQPQGEQVQEFYATIPVRLDILGTFHELETFFDRISKLNRILKVDNLSISRTKDSREPTLQVNCTIMTFRFLESPAPGPVKK